MGIKENALYLLFFQNEKKKIYEVKLFFRESNYDIQMTNTFSPFFLVNKKIKTWSNYGNSFFLCNYYHF